MEARKMLVWAVFLLVLSPVSAELLVDLGDYTIYNPEIIIKSSEPVRLDLKALTSADFKTIYPLCVEPAIGTSVYETQYSLFTKSGVADGACEGGTSHYLAPGDYILRLEATDKGDLKTIALVQFHVFGLTITQTAPASLMSPARPPSVTFKTEKSKPVLGLESPIPTPTPAYCRYGTQLPPNRGLAQTRFEDLPGIVSDGQKLDTHTISFDYTGDIYVICKEEVTAGQKADKVMKLQFDATPPRVSYTLTPQRVTSVREGIGTSRVSVQTDDRSACELKDAAMVPTMFLGESFSDYGTYATTHSIDLEYDPDIVGTAERNFSYTVRCVNLAGHANTTRFNVTVNFADAVDLQVLEPGEIVTDPYVTLVVLPRVYDQADPPVTECYVNDNNRKLPANRMQEDTIEDEEGYDVTVYSASFSFATDGSQDGKKQFKVDCYGRKTASVEHNVTLDSIPPTAPIVNASGLICSGNLSVEFKSIDEGLGVAGYNYTAHDDKGVLIKGVTPRAGVSFRPARAIEGQLDWEVFAIDGAGNKGPIGTDAVADVRMGEDEQCGMPPFITLVAPNMGFALAKPYTLELATARPAACRYALLSGIPWSSLTPFQTSNGGLTHTKTGLQDTDKLLYITCNETAANRIHLTQVRIGIDSTAPRISIEDFGKNPLLDQADKTIPLLVRTDDRSYCYIDGEPMSELPDDDQGAYTFDHSGVLDYRHITSPARQTFEHEITCKNLALLTNSSAYEAVIHLGSGFGIEVLSPPEYIAEDHALLSAMPNKQADCVWRLAGGDDQPFTDVAGNIHNVTLIDLEDKTHQAIISCTGVSDEGTASWTFTVDTSVPGIEDLRGPTVICPGGPALYRFNATGLDTQPVISYALISSSGAGAEFAKNTTDTVISIDTATLLPDTYELAVTPINRAGTRGDTATLSIDVKSRTSAACTLPPDHCTNKVEDEGEEGIDCGGTCAQACVPCSVDEECPDGQECKDNVCVDSGCASSDQCEPGEACVEGVCELSGCYPACGEGKVCDEAAHSCVSIIDCTTQACPTGTVCNAEKACVAITECSAVKPCAQGFVCDQEKRCVEVLECTTSADCEDLECWNGLCVPGNRCATALDCSSGQICTLNDTCAAVKECASTTNCPTGLTCTEDGLCAAATLCAPDEPCPFQPSACTEAGFCIGVKPCTGAADCPDGLSCISSKCTEAPPTGGCIDATDCDEGQECSYGVCRYPSTDECSMDNPCPAGETCSYGTCIPDTGTDTPWEPDPRTEPGDEESHLLSILLVALGMAIMGGAGYFLYQQNQEKEASRRQALAAQAVPRRPAGQMAPALAAHYGQDKAQRQAALQAEYERRQAEKAKREELFQGFKPTPDSKAGATVKPDAKPESAPDEDKGPESDYVDLSKLKAPTTSTAKSTAKNAAKGTAKDIEGGGKKQGKGAAKAGAKDEDVFDELEKIGK